MISTDTRSTLLRFARVVHVLEEDPDLAAGIAGAERPIAVQHALAPAIEHRRGTWEFFPAPDSGALGALILDGLIVIRIDAGERTHLELLGPGDVISPWVGSGPDLELPTVASTEAVTALRIALLDRRFTLRTARWPEIHAAIVQRLVMRARRLSLQAAINAVPRIEERLELTLWHLAYRFGRVTTDGVKLQPHFTHTQLADIIAAQRPSVTTALGALEDRGRLQRPAEGDWILCGPPPERLEPLSRQSGLAA